jgi:hypothetical protein
MGRGGVSDGIAGDVVAAIQEIFGRQEDVQSARDGYARESVEDDELRQAQGVLVVLELVSGGARRE